MQFTSILALAPLALAAPLTTRDSQSFTVISARSASPVHLMPWVARNGGIFLGGNTDAYCPLPAPDCAGYQNITAFAGQVGSPVTIAMRADLAGGQMLYVAKDGSLHPSTPHSSVIPDGATENGFYLSEPNSAGNGELSYGVNGTDGFVACQTDDGDYQVFADVDGGNFDNCIGFDALTHTFTGEAAFEYA